MKGIAYDHVFQYDDSGTEKNLNVVQQNKLSHIIAYALHLEETKHADAYDPTKWTKDEFDTWQRNHFAKWKAQQTLNNTAVTTSTNQFAIQSKVKFELDSFMKVTKNITDLPKLTKEELWYTFKLKFEKMAKTQRFHRILDTNYETKSAFEGTLVDLDLKLFKEQ